jgi:hypothetical protein
MEIDEVGEATVGDLRPAWVCHGVCVCFFFFKKIFFKVWETLQFERVSAISPHFWVSKLI